MSFAYFHCLNTYDLSKVANWYKYKTDYPCSLKCEIILYIDLKTTNTTNPVLQMPWVIISISVTSLGKSKCTNQVTILTVDIVTINIHFTVMYTFITAILL